MCCISSSNSLLLYLSLLISLSRPHTNTIKWPSTINEDRGPNCGIPFRGECQRVVKLFKTYLCVHLGIRMIVYSGTFWIPYAHVFCAFHFCTCVLWVRKLWSRPTAFYLIFIFISILEISCLSGVKFSLFFYNRHFRKIILYIIPLLKWLLVIACRLHV